MTKSKKLHLWFKNNLEKDKINNKILIRYKIKIWSNKIKNLKMILKIY